MFFSKWHLITLVLIVIAWVALIAGGYERRVVLRSGFGAVVMLYIVTTIPIATITYNEKSMEMKMRAEVARHYEYKMEQLGDSVRDIDRLALAAGSFRDDKSFKIKLYAGNYNDSYRFTGTLIVTTYDEQDKELDRKTYEKVTVEPGEVKEIDTYYSSTSFEKYRYEFIPQNE